MKPPETSFFRTEANLFRACAAFVLLSILMTTTAAVAAEENAPATNTPLALHPENPRYFLFRDQPAILVTSGEHYGALLNGEFDFETYFATLAADGFNLTRIFSGAYCEQIGAFKIERNTLAPAEGQLVAPWLRSDTPGYANGGKVRSFTVEPRLLRTFGGADEKVLPVTASPSSSCFSVPSTAMICGR